MDKVSFKRLQKVEFHSIKDLQKLHHNNGQQYDKWDKIMSLLFLPLLLIFDLTL